MRTRVSGVACVLSGRYALGRPVDALVNNADVGLLSVVEERSLRGTAPLRRAYSREWRTGRVPTPRRGMWPRRSGEP